jgi:hypothetical protein
MCYKSPWGRGREKRCPSTLAGGPWRRPLDIKLGRNYPLARHDQGSGRPATKDCSLRLQRTTFHYFSTIHARCDCGHVRVGAPGRGGESTPACGDNVVPDPVYPGMLVRDAGGPEGLYVNLAIQVEACAAVIADPRVRAATVTGSGHSVRTLLRRPGARSPGARRSRNRRGRDHRSPADQTPAAARTHNGRLHHRGHDPPNQTPAARDHNRLRGLGLRT